MSREKDLEFYLKLREEIKKRKPVFLRHLWWKKPKFKNDLKWRKPKGIDNKMRLQLKGYPSIVKIGYRGPRLVRGMHPQGLIPVVVNNIDELSKYNPAVHIIYIGGNVGLRKALDIYKTAIEKGFKIANPPKAEAVKGVSQ